MVKKRGKPSASGPSAGLYRFMRAVLGDEISDAEIGRAWGMDKKSFWRLKYDKSSMPTIDKIDRLADILGTSRHVVMAVAGGMPWEELAEAVRRRDAAKQISLLGRWAGAALPTPTGPEHLKSLMFDNLSDLIVGTDLKGTILACNRACSEVFGYEPHELIGKHTDTLYASKRESLRASMRTRRALMERKPFREVLRYRRKDGTEFDGELAGGVVFDEQGRPQGGVGIIRDVSRTSGARRRAADAGA